jgi:hypothetical protein
MINKKELFSFWVSFTFQWYNMCIFDTHYPAVYSSRLSSSWSFLCLLTYLLRTNIPTIFILSNPIVSVDLCLYILNMPPCSYLPTYSIFPRIHSHIHLPNPLHNLLQVHSPLCMYICVPACLSTNLSTHLPPCFQFTYLPKRRIRSIIHPSIYAPPNYEICSDVRVTQI